MALSEVLGRLLNGDDVSPVAVESAFMDLMTGKANDVQIGAFLIAMRMRGETASDIERAASVMRSLMTPVQIDRPNPVDIVGTGGDGANLFNVSTASSIVAAAAGVTVAKHGNRGVSSSSGSADLLEAAGVNLDLSIEAVKRCIESVGIGFMFAVNHHRAMKYAIGARKALGQRTIFNLLGPLTNPAGVKHQVVGVYSKYWVRPVAEALKNLGSEHVLVIHSADGLDEISGASDSYIAELKNGNISEYIIKPEDFGFDRLEHFDDLIVDSPEASLALIKDAFANKNDRAALLISLNAGAAIYVSGEASTLAEGVQIASDVLASGMASEKLIELSSFTQLAEV